MKRALIVASVGVLASTVWVAALRDRSSTKRGLVAGSAEARRNRLFHYSSQRLPMSPGASRRLPRTAEVCPAEVRPGKVRRGEVRHVEVRPAEVRSAVVRHGSTP